MSINNNIVKLTLPSGQSGTHQGGQLVRMVCAIINYLLSSKISGTAFPVKLFNDPFRGFIVQVGKMGKEGTIRIECVKAKNCYFRDTDGTLVQTGVGLCGSGLNSPSGKPSAIFKLCEEVLCRVGCTLSMEDTITGPLFDGSPKLMTTNTTLVINFDITDIVLGCDEMDEFDCRGSSILNLFQSRYLFNLPKGLVVFDNVLVRSIQKIGKRKAELAASIGWFAFLLKYFVPGSTFNVLEKVRKGRLEFAKISIEFGPLFVMPEEISEEILEEGCKQLYNGTSEKVLELIGETVVPFLAFQENGGRIRVHMPLNEYLDTFHIGDSGYIFSRVQLSDGLVVVNE